MKNCNDKPVAFASRTLATAEQHYSQLDKESLAIVFGVKKFHISTYVADNLQSYLITDHCSTYLRSQTQCQPWLQPEYRH